ncbi:MAG: hypothetical protein H0T73_03505 [Ardenticatenales bacterium]|nr:hypothetical protein [Ardenticatenales bacterium]
MTLNGRMFGIGLASRELIRQLQILLLNFGVFSRIHRSAERAWALTVAGEALDILATFLEFEEVWKTERIGRRNEGRLLKPSNYATLMPRPLTDALQSLRKESGKSLRGLYGGSTSEYYTTKTNLNRKDRMDRAMTARLHGYFDDATSAYASRFFEHDQPGCLYVEVEAIERGFAEVFDLTVPGSHSFIANGLCNHNTSNVPNHYTVEQTAKLYEMMYDLGCKGGTIYRDGSRDEQVLNLKEEDKAEKKPEIKAEVAPTPEVSPNYTNRGDHKRARPRSLKGATYFVNTPVGKAYVTVNRNGGDQPFEVFANVGKVGSEGAAMSEAIGRLISLVLRLPSHISPSERLEMVISQLEGIGGSRSIGFGANRVTSLPDALAQVLREDLAAHRDEDAGYLLGEAQPEPKQLELLASTMNADLCPECGHSTFVRIEGCKKCYSCGHSEC